MVKYDSFKNNFYIAWQIFFRDLKTTYKGSFLGIFWLFVPPFATAIIWIFITNSKIIQINDTPMYYPAFVFSGTVIWSLFAESLTKPLIRYKSGLSLLSKISVPKEVYLYVSFLDILLSLIIKILILIPVLWSMGYPPGFHTIISIIILLTLIVMSFSLSLLLLPISLLYGDIIKILNLFLPFLMYLTPVVYPINLSNKYYFLSHINPITAYLEFARSFLGNYSFTLSNSFFSWFFISLILLIFGIYLLRLSLPLIIERNSN
jgi:lipopolysaccharide transport system permease protein